MSLELIAATTSAVQFELGTLSIGDAWPVIAIGLGVDEKVFVEIPDGAGGWATYIATGLDVELSDEDNKVLIDVPGRYRLNKTATASPVSVFLDDR